MHAFPSFQLWNRQHTKHTITLFSAKSSHQMMLALSEEYFIITISKSLPRLDFCSTRFTSSHVQTYVCMHVIMHEEDGWMDGWWRKEVQFRALVALKGKILYRVELCREQERIIANSRPFSPLCTRTLWQYYALQRWAQVRFDSFILQHFNMGGKIKIFLFWRMESKKIPNLIQILFLSIQHLFKFLCEYPPG